MCCVVVSSLSIRRFWGKGERWKRKKERAEVSGVSEGKGKDGSEKRRELKERNLSLLPLPPPPSKNLLSPSPSGRPDTQATSFQNAHPLLGPGNDVPNASRDSTP